MEVRSVEAVVRALNDAKVRYLIVGGVAVNAHGYERMTIDLDLVIQLNRPNIEAAWGALVSIGYIVKIPVSAAEFSNVTLREAWQREKGMLVLQFWSDIHRRTPIDIFVREPFDFEKEYSDALSYELPSGQSTKVVARQTLLKMKREAGRGQDLIDVEKLEKLYE